jgi:hypothetical protein
MCWNILHIPMTSFRPAHLGSRWNNEGPPICQWTRSERTGAHTACQSANSIHCWTICNE